MMRRNIIIIFMSIELILNAVNINLIAFSYQLQNGIGQVFAIFVIAVAAAEAAVGLGIILAFYRNKETINIDEMNVDADGSGSMDLIWLIPLLPALGAAINGLIGIRAFSKRMSGLLACATMAGRARPVAERVLGTARPAAGGARSRRDAGRLDSADSARHGARHRLVPDSVGVPARSAVRR